jgi:triosephosphate isomerase
MRQLIAGNWKMNGDSTSLAAILAIRRAIEAGTPPADVLICPPATLISRASDVSAGAVPIGAQDCHAEPGGAFTGDISAEMLRDAGARAVIVGHSERRRYHGETSPQVAAKANAAWRAGLMAIVCIGETDLERQAGSAFAVCGRHLAESIPDGANAINMVIAYEPVWAIGTGQTPSTREISDMHRHIKNCLGERFMKADDIRILYGGSVNPANASEILKLANVGGVLVGGASRSAEDFLAILAGARTPP